MKIVQHIQRAVGITANKSSAALRLGAGITGDVTGTFIAVTGGAVAITGGAVAVAGAAVYAGGVTVMSMGGRVCEKSQAFCDRAYDEMMAPLPPKQEVAEEAPPAPPVAAFA